MCWHWYQSITWPRPAPRPALRRDLVNRTTVWDARLPSTVINRNRAAPPLKLILIGRHNLFLNNIMASVYAKSTVFSFFVLLWTLGCFGSAGWFWKIFYIVLDTFDTPRLSVASQAGAFFFFFFLYGRQLSPNKIDVYIHSTVTKLQWRVYKSVRISHSRVTSPRFNLTIFHYDYILELWQYFIMIIY